MARLIVFPLIIAVAVLTYKNSWDGLFVFDDMVAIVRNQDVVNASSTLDDVLKHDFWGQNIADSTSHKSYRPVTTILFKLLFTWFDARPSAYHLTNSILHAINSWQVAILFDMLYDFRHFYHKTRTRLSYPAIFCGLLFAVHPIHTEAVASIVGAADLLSTGFFLAAFLLYYKAMQTESDFHASDKLSALRSKSAVHSWLWLMASCLCFIVALFSKETAVTLVPLLFLLDGVLIKLHTQLEAPQASEPSRSATSTTSTTSRLRNRHRPELPAANKFHRLAAFSILLAVYLAIRYRIGNGQLAPHLRRLLDNPGTFQPFPLNYLYYAVTHSHYLFLLVYPWDVSCDYSYQCIPLVQSIYDVRLLWVLLAYAVVTVFLLWGWRRYRRVGVSIFSRKFPVCVSTRETALLLATLFVLVPFLLFSQFVVPIGTTVAERLLYLPSVGFCLVTTHVVMVVYHRLAAKGKVVRLLCLSFGAFWLMSWIFWCRKHNENWLNEQNLFENALSVCPNSAKMQLNVGIVQLKQRNFTVAQSHINRARTLYPEYCEVDYWMARTYLDQQLLEHIPAAIQHFQKAIDCAEHRTYSLHALEQIYGELLARTPNAPNHLNDLGSVLFLQNRYAEGVEKVKQALQVEPDFQPAKETMRRMKRLLQEKLQNQKLRDRTSASL